MQPHPIAEEMTPGIPGPGLEISVQAVPSTLLLTGGQVIPFRKAMLIMRNTDQLALNGFVPHATIAQEGGSIQDGTEALSRTNPLGVLPAGGTLAWDVYELLTSVNPGVASKVHLFGHKAVLNWWYDLTAWAEVLISGESTSIQTPIYQWKLRWSQARNPQDGIELSIDPNGAKK